MAAKNDKSVTTWNLPRPCATFHEKYDSIQDQLKALSYMDELLSGEHFINLVYHSSVYDFLNTNIQNTVLAGRKSAMADDVVQIALKSVDRFVLPSFVAAITAYNGFC